MKGIPPVLTAVLFVLIFFRAAAMSMTWDESYTVCTYAADFAKIFSPADFFPNNHIPHTLLVGIMFQLFPYQEWAMRLPAALAGCGVVLLLWKIGQTFFAHSKYKNFNTLFLIAIVSLHPLVFQFLSFARGYSAALFFSLLGFYLLIQRAENAVSRPLLYAGLSFGFSVAFNLSAALFNTALILSFFFLETIHGRFQLRDVPKFLLFFCLSGGAVVLFFYAPILLSVPPGQFNYASDSLFTGILDMSVWTLGTSNVIPNEAMTRLLCGVPVSDEMFFLAAVLLPVIAVVLLTAGLTACLRSDSDARPAAVTALAVTLYIVLLVILGISGIVMFPKDRTGILPLAYLMMLPVFVRNYAENKPVQRVLTAGIVLVLLHFGSLFAFPYYHNFWYADCDVRTIMKQADTIFKEHQPPKRVVCLFLNETAVQFYKAKYAIDDVEYLAVHQLDELEKILKKPGSTLLIMPEEVLALKTDKYRVLYRNRYTGVALLQPL
ncbi:MAG: glycosyltransferase family 39 protein [Planctomycetaceae bacterium]|jgi:hypothetical protein|nr:glycosyltransferase family 39 protein [Planctomycetaceae bacterium]